MQLTGELKEKVENAKSAEEAKKILKDAGVELSDTELDQVAGGQGDCPIFTGSLSISVSTPITPINDSPCIGHSFFID
ncbi:MAG: hypothetical protein IJJ13_08545 [Lachnospiraceae bacterium]|nr:hypothetical protein [Lachnospiraceae bacterium]